MTESVLSFEAIDHEFASPDRTPLHVLSRISFGVPSGGFTAVIGPSGCGKSTLLHMAAGLQMPKRGLVRHRGQRVAGVNRNVGFVPQQAQLFPWKTLLENVELPLVLRDVAPAERKRRVADVLRSVGLDGFEHHYPRQLSGGMQKRASIARTLVYRPDVVLMDEPFGALDAQTRMLMQDDLQQLSREAGATVLFVTHDISEAVLLADNVIVLSQRPACILADIPIALPRPRNVFEPFKTPGFEDAYERVWAAFRSEMQSARRASTAGARA